MHLLLISGSTRAASTNTAVLRTAQHLATFGTTLYDELSALPAFNPDDDREPLPPVVARLREQVEAADAILFCTPEHAGALPGSFKNRRLHRRPPSTVAGIHQTLTTLSQPVGRVPTDR